MYLPPDQEDVPDSGAAHPGPYMLDFLSRARVTAQSAAVLLKVTKQVLDVLTEKESMTNAGGATTESKRKNSALPKFEEFLKGDWRIQNRWNVALFC